MRRCPAGLTPGVLALLYITLHGFLSSFGRRTASAPSGSVQDEGSKRVVFSGLNHTTFDLAVYASQDGSPHHHARLASGCWFSFARRDSYPQGFSERYQSSSLFLLPKAYLTQGHHT